MVSYLVQCNIISCMIGLTLCIVFFCKQKTAYEMRISDWSSDVCSSDLFDDPRAGEHVAGDRDAVADQMAGPVDAVGAGEGGAAPGGVDHVDLARMPPRVSGGHHLERLRRAGAAGAQRDAVGAVQRAHEGLDRRIVV